MTLQEQYDAMKTKLIRATTLKEEALKSLKKEFDCDTIEQAVELLDTMQDDATQLESKINERLRRFKQKYATQLGIDEEDD